MSSVLKNVMGHFEMCRGVPQPYGVSVCHSLASSITSHCLVSFLSDMTDYFTFPGCLAQFVFIQIQYNCL